MASYGLTHFFKGGTKDQYDNMRAVVHPDGGKGLPPGQTYHAAGPTSDGFLVVAIWDSKRSWETFRDEKLVPGFAEVENGLPAPPVETNFEIHNEQTA